MRRFAVLTTPVLLSCMAYVPARGQTLPRGYEIIDVTRDQLRQEKPRLNDAGQLVFHAVLPGNRWEIMLYDTDGSLIQLTHDDVFDTLPDIADDGTVVWMKWIGPPNENGPTPEIMMRTPDGTITQLTDDPAEDWSPRVNGLRHVAWKKYGPVVCVGLESMDIFTYDGSVTSRLTTSGETYGYANQSPEISDADQIVWTEYDFCDPPPGYNFTSKIMMYSNGEILEVTNGQQFPQAPDLNNNSQVVFDHYDPDLDLYFIDMWDDGVTRTLIADGDIPAINDRGAIGFNRWDHARDHWDVWLYRDGEELQITRDSFDNIVPDINNKVELCWGFGTNHARLDIRYMRRFDAGDLNCDGFVNAFDIEPMLWALFDPQIYDTRLPQCDPLLADFDKNGRVDAFDIEPFVALLFP